MAPRLPAPTTGPDACKVWEIKTQGKADDAKAREMLERTAWQVQPIMRKRGWRVGTLLEMPDRVKDRYGDNWNKGERVRLKLRKGAGEWFDYEHVVLVMLHELCHNDIGPHNKQFFALLDEITQECEDLMARGVGGTGAGFDAKGTRLGHRGGWGGTETRDAKTAAVEAARKRAQQHAVMGPPGGRRLGGGDARGAPRPADPRAAAAAAAERRLRAETFAREHGLMDDVVVLSDDEEDEGEEREERTDADSRAKPTAGADANATLRLGGDEENVASEVGVAPKLGRVRCPCCAAFAVDRAHVEWCEAKRRGRGKRPETKATEANPNARAISTVDLRSPPGWSSSPTTRSRSRTAAGSPRTSKKRAKVTSEPGATLDDDDDDDVIVIDDDDDDDDEKTGAGAGGVVASGSRGPRGRAGSKTWTCGACTLTNLESASHCAACERWRFSRGPPAASRPTGFGIDD